MMKSSEPALSLRDYLYIVDPKYLDAVIDIAADPINGLTKDEVEKYQNDGKRNVFPGVHKTSWYDGILCCGSRTRDQEERDKLIKKHLSDHSTVIRHGSKMKIHRDEIVPGDILLINKGDRVNADVQLVDIKHPITVRAFLYTESSEDIPKGFGKSSGHPWQRDNIIMAGSLVLCGEGKAVVLAVGEETAIGRILSKLHGDTHNRSVQLHFKKAGRDEDLDQTTEKETYAIESA